MTKEEFRQWRLDAGMTQEELGYVLGMHSVTVSKMERGILACPDIEYGMKKLIRRAEVAKKILERT